MYLFKAGLLKLSKKRLFFCLFVFLFTKKVFEVQSVNVNAICTQRYPSELAKASVPSALPQRWEGWGRDGEKRRRLLGVEALSVLNEGTALAPGGLSISQIALVPHTLHAPQASAPLWAAKG